MSADARVRAPSLFPILILCLALPLLPVAEGPRASAEEGAPPARRAGVRLETDVSFTTNLVHWVDNLAGTSAGKTLPVYRRYWEERFGAPDAADRAALQAFARIRNLPVPPTGRDVANATGCLPVESEGMGWHQIFLSEAMGARTIEDLSRALSPYLSAGDREELAAALERFRPRFERVWSDLGHVRRFDRRFRRFLEEGSLLAYLDKVAGFFGVDAAAAPPMRISFIGLPVDGSTHAEADGDRLLVEIRPHDAPSDQIPVVSHEASHFLMHRMTAQAVDRLASQAHSRGEGGALVWRYLWEGIPTALGQGLAEARLSPATFSRSQRWYHIDTIDRFAKMIFPEVESAVEAGRGIADGLMPRIAELVQRSELIREARAPEFLMTGFFASGSGMSAPMEAMRRRSGLARSGSANVFDLAGEAGHDLLRRYSCLGGVALVSPSELDAAAALDGTPLLPPETLARIRSRSLLGDGVIAVGRRPGGGLVYLLVSPAPERAGEVLEAFLRLRGVPEGPILVRAGGGS